MYSRRGEQVQCSETNNCTCRFLCTALSCPPPSCFHSPRTPSDRIVIWNTLCKHAQSLHNAAAENARKIGRRKLRGRCGDRGEPRRACSGHCSSALGGPKHETLQTKHLICNLLGTLRGAIGGGKGACLPNPALCMWPEPDADPASSHQSG